MSTETIDLPPVVSPVPLPARPDAGQRPVETPGDVRQATIMIVDDEPMNIKVVRRLLEIDGFTRFLSTTDSPQAVKMIRSERPDLLLLDLMMPQVGGLEILAEVRQDPKIADLPILVVTGATDRETRLQVWEQGATDFLTKPVDPSELTPRVRNVLTVRQYHNHLKNYAADLEAAVQHRTAELESSRQDVLHCLARAAEYRDDDTGAHVLRVGRYARLIGEALGFSEKEARDLELAAQLHDVGKIGVPDSVLMKNGALTDEEFALMKKHSGFGKRILAQSSSDEQETIKRHAEVGAQILRVGSSPILELATRIALTHHEWWDGRGYPLGLAGEDIPLEGRITAVADVFDALSSRRCYKEPFPLEKCFSILREESGTHFDPAVIDAFFQRRSDIVAVQMQLADEV
jgi:putative two-component system response regulator